MQGDTATSLKAVVVNQTLAKLYFPHGDAIGHSFTVADPGVKGTWQIVGIVRDSSSGHQPNRTGADGVPACDRN